VSYDLYFWRQTKDLQIRPEQIVDLLSKDEPVDGIVSFPRSDIRAVLKRYFPDIADGDADLEWEGADSYFQIGFGHATEKDVHMIIVNCGYALLQSEETMNRIIEACNSLGCALYDPQRGQRYAQPEPKNAANS
jgi:hypothetical protein